MPSTLAIVGLAAMLMPDMIAAMCTDAKRVNGKISAFCTDEVTGH